MAADITVDNGGAASLAARMTLSIAIGTAVVPSSVTGAAAIGRGGWSVIWDRLGSARTACAEVGWQGVTSTGRAASRAASAGVCAAAPSVGAAAALGPRPYDASAPSMSAHSGARTCGGNAARICICDS